MRAGNVRHGEAGDGGVEIEEGFVSHDRGYLGAEAAGLEILVDDEAAAGAADGVQNHLAVPRHQGAEVDDICRNARSEEHTSELQSLMRISYAVFCLKKKQKHIPTYYNANY